MSLYDFVGSQFATDLPTLGVMASVIGFSWWLVIGLALVLVLGFEGAYRLHETQVSDVEIDEKLSGYYKQFHELLRREVSVDDIGDFAREYEAATNEAYAWIAANMGRLKAERFLNVSAAEEAGGDSASAKRSNVRRKCRCVMDNITALTV